MHVGDGEAKYSIIDNEVQKDSVLTYNPVIHASGLKGALKEHFEKVWGKEDPRIVDIFGDKDKEGEYKFFSAHLIARPLRVSEGECPYVLATSEDILADFSYLLESLGLGHFYKFTSVSVAENQFFSNAKITTIEGKPVLKQIDDKIVADLQTVIGDQVAIANSLCDYDLPVRARNKLENGRSIHLWNEELVPHKSIFYFVIITRGDECKLPFEQNKPVQFGGNASIGNGYTIIKKMAESKGGV